MRILFVAMPFSPHTARWINQVRDEGMEIHLFSSMDNVDVHEDLNGITFHENFFEYRGEKDINLRSIQMRALGGVSSIWAKKVVSKCMSVADLKMNRVEKLAKVIERIRPDIVHSLETQHAGYLAFDSYELIQNRPKWVHSTWGIDIHFFGRLKMHHERLKKVFTNIDHLVVEGSRDLLLAKKFGYVRNEFSIFSSVGGGLRQIVNVFTLPSSRKVILLKGTQDIVRRGLVGLRALAKCSDVLGRFEIILHSSNEVTRAAAELFEDETGHKVTILNEVTYYEMHRISATARVSITINMSDGVPNTMLEAMNVGAFPIQSNTSMASEWINDGSTGFLVPPEDPDIIALAIRRALLDDELVDKAAEINMRKIREELDYDIVRGRVIDFYQHLK